MRKLEKYVQTHLQTELDIIRSSERANVLLELSIEEKAIIYRYTDSGHFVNETLRESKGEKVPQFAKFLDNVLTKIASYNLVVYRGLQFSASKLEKYKRALENETPIIEYGFMSSSIRKSTATQFGTIILRIFSKNGKFIEKVSKFGVYSPFNEREILFTKNSQFIVLEIEEENPYFIITLIEI